MPKTIESPENIQHPTESDSQSPPELSLDQQWIVKVFCNRVFEEWLPLAQLSGAISIPGYERNHSYFSKPDWQPRDWTWLDPRVEGESSLKFVESRKQGKNFGEFIDECKRDLAELEAELQQEESEPDILI